MGFVRRFRQRRQKLKHIRERAKALLPLCEDATGIKLEGRLKIEAARKWKIHTRYLVDLLEGAGWRGGTSFNQNTALGLGIAMRKFICKQFENADGYQYSKKINHRNQSGQLRRRKCPFGICARS